MLKPEEENEAEVRREDQDNINKFARLNAKLHEVRAEREQLKVRGAPTIIRQHCFCYIFVLLSCWMFVLCMSV